MIEPASGALFPAKNHGADAISLPAFKHLKALVFGFLPVLLVQWVVLLSAREACVLRASNGDDSGAFFVTHLVLPLGTFVPLSS
ncbi:hypothetical protein D3C81_1773320 [compost metagenome]